MKPRKIKERKPVRHDTLGMVMASMQVGDDGIICTSRTYKNIQSRLIVFKNYYPKRNYIMHQINGLTHIKRSA